MNTREFLKKYGDIEVKFEGYYKYVFTFGGITNYGGSLTVYVGGEADVVYGFSVKPDEFYRVKDIFIGNVGYEIDGEYHNVE